MLVVCRSSAHKDAYPGNAAGSFRTILPKFPNVTDIKKMTLLEAILPGVKKEEIVCICCSAISHSLVGAEWRRVLRVVLLRGESKGEKNSDKSEAGKIETGKTDAAKKQDKALPSSKYTFPNPISCDVSCPQVSEIKFDLVGKDGSVVDFGNGTESYLVLELQ
jgi:hypothetical protein